MFTILFWIVLLSALVNLSRFIYRLAFPKTTFTYCPKCGEHLPAHVGACEWKQPVKPKLPVGSVIVLIICILPALFGLYVETTSPSSPSTYPTLTAEQMTQFQDGVHQAQCADDLANHVPIELSRCPQPTTPMPPTQPPHALTYVAQYSDLSSPCPNGCPEHITGCDIKGNVKFDTEEKIYHVPGGLYYDTTTIDPAYGELWFCTEQEAITNGWRKSYQ